MEQQASGSNWADVLIKGISGYVDSQVAKNYAVANGAYNTAGGTAGQSQFGSLASNPAVLIGGAILIGVVLLIALKR